MCTMELKLFNEDTINKISGLNPNFINGLKTKITFLVINSTRWVSE
jgi:hypothetical protein